MNLHDARTRDHVMPTTTHDDEVHADKGYQVYMNKVRQVYR